MCMHGCDRRNKIPIFDDELSMVFASKCLKRMCKIIGSKVYDSLAPESFASVWCLMPSAEAPREDM